MKMQRKRKLTFLRRQRDATERIRALFFWARQRDAAERARAVGVDSVFAASASMKRALFEIWMRRLENSLNQSNPQRNELEFRNSRLRCERRENKPMTFNFRDSILTLVRWDVHGWWGRPPIQRSRRRLRRRRRRQWGLKYEENEGWNGSSSSSHMRLWCSHFLGWYPKWVFSGSLRFVDLRRKWQKKCGDFGGLFGARGLV